MHVSSSCGSKHVNWNLMPDGQLVVTWTPSEEILLLCIGGSVLAGKVDMFPTYEALFSLKITNFERLQSDFSKLSHYKSAQDIFQSRRAPQTNSREISFFKQNRGGESRRIENDHSVIESFLHAVAVQGCGLFFVDSHGYTHYKPSKAVTIGMFSYPLALNTTFLLRSAFKATLDTLQESGLPSSQPLTARGPSQCTSPPASAVSPAVMLCVPSSLSVRGRHDLLESVSAARAHTEVRSIVR